jgi:hypothetical protein
VVNRPQISEILFQFNDEYTLVIVTVLILGKTSKRIKKFDPEIPAVDILRTYMDFITEWPDDEGSKR